MSSPFIFSQSLTQSSNFDSTCSHILPIACFHAATCVAVLVGKSSAYLATSFHASSTLASAVVADLFFDKLAILGLIAWVNIFVGSHHFIVASAADHAHNKPPATLPIQTSAGSTSHSLTIQKAAHSAAHSVPKATTLLNRGYLLINEDSQGSLVAAPHAHFVAKTLNHTSPTNSPALVAAASPSTPASR